MKKAFTLSNDEHVLHVVRRHWFRLAVEAVGLSIIFLVLFVFFTGAALSLVQGGAVLGTAAFGVELYTLGMAGLALWVRFFIVWSDHYLDAWLVTNERIIDIEQKGFFHREVSSFPLSRVQDATFETQGIVATWLNFGDVQIRTASTSETFIMKSVPHPAAVKEKVIDAVQASQTKNNP